jgi:glutathione synthase/RimK-type ligase-like ATP-grasp enzyme
LKQDAIVIVSYSGDRHADALEQRLIDMGEEPFRLDTNELPERLVVSLTFAADGAAGWTGRIRHVETDRQLDLDDIRSIWWRRPLPYFGLDPDLDLQEREFAKGELEHTFRSFWQLADGYWMSHPEHIRAASSKLEQLDRARRMGFAAPSTIVTTDPDEIEAFFDEQSGDVIYKVLTDPLLGYSATKQKYPNEQMQAPRETKTTRVTAEMVAQLGGVSLAPCLFQSYVPKAHEIRATVIGDDVFAVEIHSQDDPSTEVDWRAWADAGLAIPYKPATLPAELESRCHEFVHSYGLNYGAIDLVCTPEGDHVFLENNPVGQFIWVEMLAPELCMTDAVATCLSRGSNG